MAMSQKPTFNDQSKRQEAHSTAPATLVQLAALADVRFNGSRAWDIQVHDNQLYQRILTSGSLGFGEAYMEGMWSCRALDEMFNRFMSANIDEKIKTWNRLRLLGEVIRQKLFNLQSPQRSYRVGKHHYDIGHDVFEAMLDPTLSYSCGYWKNADNLHQAQLDKMDLICRKLELKSDESLLEIGCGWGGLAHYAAKNYGVHVTGISVSKAQKQYAEKLCKNLPVKIKLMDYRQLSGQYDKVVSVGMFEHVGRKNYPVYFDTVSQLLKDEGLFLLHSIGNYLTVLYVDKWIDRYIFPNGKLPSSVELSEVLEKRFLIEDWHNFGQDYDHTLMSWWENFDKNWPSLSSKYSKRFYRMWHYYLMSCAGFFRSRQGQLWQLVLSKRSRKQQYRSIR